MNKLPFLKELTEARLFTGVDTIKGKSVEDIASIVYLMIMMLEITRHTNHSYAADYASKTLAYSTYENMYYAGTDLGNLLAVLNNQDTFKGYIRAAKGISIPLFQINRYLNACKGSSFAHNEDAQFFYRLEDYLKLYSQSNFRQFRRDIGDWAKLTYTERNQVVLKLRQEFDRRASTCDIYLWWRQSFKLTESYVRKQPIELTFMEELYSTWIKEGRITKDQLANELFEDTTVKTAIDSFFALHKKNSLSPVTSKKYAPIGIITSGIAKTLIVYSTESEVELTEIISGGDYKFKVGDKIRRFPSDFRIQTAIGDTFFYSDMSAANSMKAVALLALGFPGWKVEQIVIKDDGSDIETVTESVQLDELKDSTLRYNPTLNPKLWDNYELLPDVKEALAKIANKFSEFIDIKQIRIVDYIITGSNCAFNYSDDSDIDIHVLVDATQLGENPLTSPFLLAKKSLWNSGHDITVKGYDVELYAEDVNDENNKLVATGVYSLLQDKWIKKPEHVEVTYDDSAVISKAEDIMSQIDELISAGSVDQAQIDKLWEHIYKMRRSGLAKGGEFATENLAFKVVRNHGYFTKLRDFEQMREDEDLTLENRTI